MLVYSYLLPLFLSICWNGLFEKWHKIGVKICRKESRRSIKHPKHEKESIASNKIQTMLGTKALRKVSICLYLLIYLVTHQLFLLSLRQHQRTRTSKSLTSKMKQQKQMIRNVMPYNDSFMIDHLAVLLLFRLIYLAVAGSIFAKKLIIAS